MAFFVLTFVADQRNALLCCEMRKIVQFLHSTSLGKATKSVAKGRKIVCFPKLSSLMVCRSQRSPRLILDSSFFTRCFKCRTSKIWFSAHWSFPNINKDIDTCVKKTAYQIFPISFFISDRVQNWA